MTENTMNFGKRNTWEIDEKAGTIKIIAEGCAQCGKMTPVADLTACHAACETRYCDHCYEAKYAGTATFKKENLDWALDAETGVFAKKTVR